MTHDESIDTWPTRITWYGFGQTWSGVATGNISKGFDYAEVIPDPECESWGPAINSEDKIRWALISLVRPPEVQVALLQKAVGQLREKSRRLEEERDAWKQKVEGDGP